MVEVGAETLRATCKNVLTSAGTPPDIAERVVCSLVDNEIAGHRSHGLLRLLDYLDDARSGHLQVGARPTVKSVSPSVRIVDGNHGFGALAVDALAANIDELLHKQSLCVIALINSGHIGRLAEIGCRVAEGGGIVLGFINYLGAGQRVVPWQGRDGRLCTNPLLIAWPGRRAPFVLDMSTSTVSEGKIRQHWLAETTIPPGWLVDANGADVLDPSRLYSDPPTAFMTPLGGSSGHKGFGLAVAVELLAGVLTGAGFAEWGVTKSGNGGLFLGLDLTLTGRTRDDVLDDVETLREHIRASAPDAVRWPGEQVCRTEIPAVIRINRATWRAITDQSTPKDQP